MKRKSLIAILMLALSGVLAVSVSIMPTAADAANAAVVNADGISLKVGGPKSYHFWPAEPENVDHDAVPDPQLCNPENTPGPCRYYKINVGPGGTRLRVALRIVYQDPDDVRLWPDFNIGGDRAMVFRVQLFGPKTTPSSLLSPSDVFPTCEVGDDSTADHEPCDRSTNTSSLNAGYAVELFALNPPEGTWTVRVIPTTVYDVAFMMRAKLEGPDEASDENVGSDPAPVLPNLRVIPPYEFSFNTPSSTVGPGAGTPGVHPSCHPEEVREAVEEAVRNDEDVVEATPKLCLRYSMGIENAGKGPFWVVGWSRLFNGDDDLTDDRLDMTQRIRYSDGSWRWEPYGSAGTSRLDPSHAHIHYLGFWKFTLLRIKTPGWRVGDKAPEVEEIGPGRKLGGLPSDEFMTDWRRFYHGIQGVDYYNAGYFEQHEYCPPSDPNCTYPFQDARLQPGWGDSYEWNRTGNYINFPTILPGVLIPVEGQFVLKGEADPGRLIKESVENDNFGYALIQVFRDGTLKLLERGYGYAPWDPRKQVLTESP